MAFRFRNAASLQAFCSTATRVLAATSWIKASVFPETTHGTSASLIKRTATKRPCSRVGTLTKECRALRDFKASAALIVRSSFSTSLIMAMNSPRFRLSMERTVDAQRKNASKRLDARTDPVAHNFERFRVGVYRAIADLG